MKAFLLAGGLGTRLRPLTDKTPKCLLPIHGKPMLEIWLNHLHRCGVDEVLINTHYLHTQVEDFAKKWKSLPKIDLRYEPTLLGSAGTLLKNRDFVEQEDLFVVCYADNLTTFDISLLIKELLKRQQEHPLGIMALHRSDEPWRCGIASLDSEGWVRKFEEKPAKPKSNLANSGLYTFTKEVLNIPFLAPYPLDIAQHLIPQLLPKILGYEINVPLIDIGTIKAYKKANEPGSQERGYLLRLEKT